MITRWGYEIDSDYYPCALLDTNDFNTLTGGKYTDFDRITAEIEAASDRIRDYVGWHLFPSCDCVLNVAVTDRRITAVRHDLLVQLPARYVTAVKEVTVCGVESNDYSLDPNGLLVLYDAHPGSRRDRIVVKYTAGLPPEMMRGIQELVAHRVTHALAVPAGITSEASGGVSVTYNAGWVNNSNATALLDNNKELLIPYMVEGVF